MRFSELDGTTVGVWGAGREIRSFAVQLSHRLPSARIGAIALDSLPDEDVAHALQAPEALVVTGPDVVAALRRCDVLVRSPGVSIHRPELCELRSAGVPVTTATALWLAEREGRGVIGVTGTKGKSTTAALIFHLIRASGRTVHLAGNIGAPALDLLDVNPNDVAVVELSSYQIADLDTGPELAVMTNLYREHIDWHGSEEVYRAEKLRIVELPGVHVAVINARDAHLSHLRPRVARTVHFGVPDGWDIVAGGIAMRGKLVLETEELPLRGEHNALNLCAALTAVSAFGLHLPSLPEALRDFRALPHRLEIVAEMNSVIWVDDSISTTPESALAAIATFSEREIVLVAGGQDRGQDYTQLGRVLAQRGAAVIGLPTTGSRLVDSSRRAGVPASRALEVADMNEAVRAARELARPGSAVLLSPAAPSYNSYRNFEERGNHFRALADQR